MGYKALETISNSNQFCSGISNNKQCSGGLINFIKETRTMKMKSTVAGPQKLSITN